MDDAVKYHFAEESFHRMSIVKLFSDSLLYPDDYFLNELKSDHLLERVMCAMGFFENEALNESCARQINCLKDEDKEGLFYRLRQEYTRLFYVENLVKPYGNDYLPAHFQERNEVERIYRRSGLKRKSGFTEHPDHIACEFDYLYYLSSMEFNAWMNESPDSAHEWREEGEEFWRYHIKEFSLQFANLLETCTVEGFYIAIARMLFYCSTEMKLY